MKPQDPKRLREHARRARSDITFLMTLIKNWASKQPIETIDWPGLSDLQGVRENLIEALVRVTYDGHSEETTRAKIMEALGK